ncbi:hypothetical protein F5148DRAFT_1335837 [Russula earlei]|uniref:Uncharacterized protein n=1 Tax=Russula earlei TaxID=71964 RepID=A0ACC0TVG1_9AGAM|nr:hypothetical protein F5148DRAFT_1335837 [Russula earlei]
MPKLLLSANHLYHLDLWNVPYSGYFSPQALVACLSVMSRLESLHVEFESPRYPASRRSLSLTRSVLPSLTKLVFRGAHQYLEDLLAQIEAPLLNKLKIGFFLDPHFVVPQLHQLINYAESFKNAPEHLFPELSLAISDPHLPLLAQVCNSSLSLLSTLVRHDFLGDSTQTSSIETTQWLELLDPFTSVTDLHLDNEHVGRVLQKLAEERVKQVLPALQKISLIDLTEPVPKYMQGFVAA